MPSPKSNTRTLELRKPFMTIILPVVIIWFLLWYWQWQVYFNPYPWLRLGVGLILFIVPGLCIYGLVVERRGITFSHVTFGFVISHLVFALLGMIGRVFHLSFEAIKFLMVLMGAFLLSGYLLAQFRAGIKLTLRNLDLSRILPIFLLILVALFACLVVIQRVLTDDDMTYLAYLTSWQNALQLDFNDVIFGVPALVHPRFWIMSAPFAQALLSDLSSVPGMVMLSGYYETFLVILAVLSWYELARTLNFSPRAAGAASMLQLVFLLLLSEYLHPGAPFYTQLSADKATAAFILAPVFFQSLIHLLDHPTKRNSLLFLLTGLSLTFMHPVILAYSVFISGVLILFRMKRLTLPRAVVPVVILLVVLAPQIALRFASTFQNMEIPYAPENVLDQQDIENLVKRWGDTRFYGFHPAILEMKIPYGNSIPLPGWLKTQGWLILPILSMIFALRRFKEQIAAQFLLGCFLMCILAGIPFSGWIIGYFLSAWMLERALWLFPYGLSVVFLLFAIRDHIRAGRTAEAGQKDASGTLSNWALVLLTVLTMGIFLLYMRENNLPDLERFKTKTQRYQGLATAGQELDRRISDQAYVIGSEQLNDLIPGISAKSKLIVFRISQPSNMPYFSDAQREERIVGVKSLFARSLPAGDKMLLLEKYDVRFLLLQPFDLRLFEEFMAHYPDRVEAMEIGGVVILQIDE